MEELICEAVAGRMRVNKVETFRRLCLSRRKVYAKKRGEPCRGCRTARLVDQGGLPGNIKLLEERCAGRGR